MSYREFRDSQGTEWQAWDVVPQLAERRTTDRRLSRVQADVERRGQLDRRLIVGRRPMLTKGLNGGWLCFEARAEKRRLSPIPDDWAQCDAHALETYCRSARTAPRVSDRFHFPEIERI